MNNHNNLFFLLLNLASPFGKTKRRRWTDAEKNVVYSIYSNVESLSKLPSTKECIKIIQEHPELKSRTPEQLKSWIDNQRKLCKD